MEKPKSTVGSWMKLKVIGKGSFGVVTLWQNIHTGDHLAIKLFREPAGAGSGGVSTREIERWAKEVEIVKKLSHPNLVVIRPTPEDLMFLALKLPILCMEYCDGGDLRKIFKRPESCCGLPEDIIRTLVINIKDALEYLHGKNIIHRDLKPENIVKKEETFKIIDLGYGKEIDKNTMLTTFVGTLQYLAPEVFSQNYSASVDYWSFGLICHEAITGVRPFLPNLQPMALKPYLEEKPNEVISIFETLDGSVEYSTEIFSENHLTSFLKDQFEDWLRLALEWNGMKRGRNQDNKIVIFSHLDAILKKTIITVFSTFTLEQLSYEVDRSTLFSTVMRWIERDTKHPAERQILLSPAGEILSEDDIAYKLWDPENTRAMIYAFDSNGLTVPKVDFKMSSSLVQMLEDPKKTLLHYFIVRLNADAVFFIQRLIYICETFVESCALKLLYILNCLGELDILKESISSEIHSCRGNLDLHCCAIEHNEKNFKKYFPQNESVPTSWKRNYDGNLHIFLKYNDRANELCLKLEKLKFDFRQIESICESSSKDVDALKIRWAERLNYHKTLTDASEEIWASESNSTDIASELYACLELRHNFFSSDHLTSCLEQIKEHEQKVGQLHPEFLKLEECLKSFSKNVKSEHLKMTQSIWQQWDSQSSATTGLSTPQNQRSVQYQSGSRDVKLSEDAEALRKENMDLRISLDETIYRFQTQQDKLRERNASVTKRLKAWNLI